LLRQKNTEAKKSGAVTVEIALCGAQCAKIGQGYLHCYPKPCLKLHGNYRHEFSVHGAVSSSRHWGDRTRDYERKRLWLPGFVLQRGAFFWALRLSGTQCLYRREMKLTVTYRAAGMNCKPGLTLSHFGCGVAKAQPVTMLMGRHGLALTGLEARPAKQA